MHPVDFFLTAVVRGGTYDQFAAGKDAHRLRRGDVALYPRQLELAAV